MPELSEVDKDQYLECLKQTCGDNLKGFKCRTLRSCENRFKLCPDFTNPLKVYFNFYSYLCELMVSKLADLLASNMDLVKRDSTSGKHAGRFYMVMPVLCYPIALSAMIMKM